MPMHLQRAADSAQPMCLARGKAMPSQRCGVTRSHLHKLIDLDYCSHVLYQGSYVDTPQNIKESCFPLRYESKNPDRTGTLRRAH